MAGAERVRSGAEAVSARSLSGTMRLTAGCRERFCVCHDDTATWKAGSVCSICGCGWAATGSMRPTSENRGSPSLASAASDSIDKLTALGLEWKRRAELANAMLAEQDKSLATQSARVEELLSIVDDLMRDTGACDHYPAPIVCRFCRARAALARGRDGA